MQDNEIKNILVPIYQKLLIPEVYLVNFNSKIYILFDRDKITNFDLYLDLISELEYKINENYEEDISPYIIQATSYKNIECFSDKKIISLL